ncbi:TIGR03086 family metal-binding protein [Yinghuangia soli]|uniref:TIGR03086 family metal-binding protein n=1 Tax=Yinghuangia soli TaxID=2908204 RepID=A0AA41PWI5_9ACTN|nr:TIGR03086 family metal-binding protein [Yinghuangia soli]MCF2525852.1 TIGR03086 family metal-binding protein [Yinghuangia soli]
MTSADGFKLLADAHSYLRTAVAGVAPDAWGDPTPCTEWTVRQVLNHARLDQQALVMQIDPASTPTSDPFSPEDALAADHVAELDAVFAAATAAWESGRDAESVPTPMGPMPANLGTAAAALDAAIHAWDIAVATGQDLPLSDELAVGLEEISARIVEFIRQSFGKYGPVVEVPDNASPAEKLLAFTGRDPKWTPPSA